jgi:hypothetical protein
MRSKRTGDAEGTGGMDVALRGWTSCQQTLPQNFLTQQ